MTDAGVYETMSSAEYFAQDDWISASRLKHHLPEHYRPSTGPSDAMDFGSALHSRVLGGPSEPVKVVPAATWQGKAAQEARTQAYSLGHIPLLEKQIPLLEAMTVAVKDHPAASGLLADGKPEVSVFADVDGIPCKARFDWLGDGYAVDLKTTSAMPSEHALTSAVLSFGYDLAADHYMRIASSAGLDVGTYLFLFVHKDNPHYVTVVELDQGFYERAAVLRDLALERLCHTEMVDPYPGASGPLNLSLPRWAAL